MVSERRKIGLVKRKCFFLMGWPLKLPKSIQNRSLPASPNMIDCVAKIAGHYAAFLSDGLSMSPPRRGRSCACYFGK